MKEYKRSNQRFLRLYNKKKLLNILREQGPMSRVDLAQIANVDKKTITNLVNALYEEGQIRSLSMESSGSGRPKEILDRDGGYCKNIGLDLGGTHVTALVMDFVGTVLASETLEMPGPSRKEDSVARCDEALASVLRALGLSWDDISRVGISFPGHIDARSGMPSLAESMPEWKGVSVRDFFAERYKKPVLAGDCSMLMALAELWFGEGRGCDNFVVFDLGLGIGCGIVVDGQLYSGTRGKAGEVGHTIVERDGALCRCGRRGCIEAYAAGWAIEEQAERCLAGKSEGLLFSRKGGEKRALIRDLIEAADLGDRDCERLLRRAGEYLGIGIANSLMLLNPKKVIIGGRLIQDNRTMLEAIKATIQEKTMPEVLRDARICVSSLGREASAIGAATLCMLEEYV